MYSCIINILYIDILPYTFYRTYLIPNIYTICTLLPYTLTYTLVDKVGSLVSIIHKLCHTVYTRGIVYSKWKPIVVMSSEANLTILTLRNCRNMMTMPNT